MVENDKTFKHFLEIPPEVRMMFVDKMEPDDRCRFSGSSKRSNSEAKNSKNYIHALGIANVLLIRISVSHNNDQMPNTNDAGYWLEFVGREWGGNFIECVSKEHQRLWLTPKDDSQNMFQYGVEYFKNMLQKYQNTVKKLSFHHDFENIDFGIRSLNNLEELEIMGNTDISQFFSKMRKPLKKLTAHDDENEIIVTDYEPIYQVQEYLTFPGLKLDNEQFLRLSAPCIQINIGYLTETDIFNFIKSWQNGTIGKKVAYYEWDLEDSDFDLECLTELLGASDHDLNAEDLQIKNYKDARKRATLGVFVFENEKLMFREEPEEDANID